MRDAGATLVAGHSAHVFHGVGDRVLLGDVIDEFREACAALGTRTTVQDERVVVEWDV